MSLCLLLSLLGCEKGGGSAVVSTDLQERAIAVLRDALHVPPGWQKVHAAETLLAVGYPDGVRGEFERELEARGSEPKYRIGIWRVLARTSGDPADRDKWVSKIAAALLDPEGPDRVHAAETLAKLGYVVREKDVPAVRAAAASPDIVQTIMMTWLLAVRDDAQAVQALTDGIASPSVDVRRLAGYAFRFRTRVAADVPRRLAEAARGEPANSTARVYLCSAAFVHAPDAAVAAEFNRVLLEYLRTGTEPDKYEAASAVAIRGGREDLPRLEQLLSDPMPDARIGAAHAILRITQATGSRAQTLPASTAPTE